MRWLTFAIFGYLALLTQLALAGFLSWGGAAPNLALPIVVFIAINAPREDALAGSFALGLLLDLLTQQPIGLHAFAFSLAALFIIGSQPAVYRDHPLTHLVLTLLAGCLVAVLVLFNGWAYPRIHSLADFTGPTVLQTMFSVCYTGLIAPLELYPLVRCKRMFGFRHQRRHGRHGLV
jgi:rod shape-determining protein MreD